MAPAARSLGGSEASKIAFIAFPDETKRGINCRIVPIRDYTIIPA